MKRVFALALIVLAGSTARADIAPPYEVHGIGAQIEEAEPFPKLVKFKMNGPADAAGLKQGDGVIAIDGSYSKGGTAPFYYYARGLTGPKDSVVELIVLRNGREVRVVKLKRTVKD